MVRRGWEEDRECLEEGEDCPAWTVHKHVGRGRRRDAT